MTTSVRSIYDCHIKDNNSIMSFIKRLTKWYLKSVINFFFSKKDTLPICEPTPAREFLYYIWYDDVKAIHGIRNRIKFLLYRITDAKELSTKDPGSRWRAIKRKTKSSILKKAGISTNTNHEMKMSNDNDNNTVICDTCAHTECLCDETVRE